MLQLTVFEISVVKRQRSVSERPKMVHPSHVLDLAFGDNERYRQQKGRRPVSIKDLPSCKNSCLSHIVRHIFQKRTYCILFSWLLMLGPCGRRPTAPCRTFQQVICGSVPMGLWKSNQYTKY